MRVNNVVCKKKILKYILMGLVMLIAARYIPEYTLTTREIITLGAISSISFALLDMSSPTLLVNLTK